MDHRGVVVGVMMTLVVLVMVGGPSYAAHVKSAETVRAEEGEHVSLFTGTRCTDIFHAHCEVQVAFRTACPDLLKRMVKSVKNILDPAGGNYTMQEENGDSIKFTHTTKVKRYIDDITMKFNVIEDNGDCVVNAHSQSETLSFYDYDTNYCNIYNIIKHIGLQFAEKVGCCLFHPGEDKSVCNKY